MKKRLSLEDKILNESLIVYLKNTYDMAIWRNFARKFPTIITKEVEIEFLDELDSFSLRYKGIIQEHKNSGMPIIKRWALIGIDYPYLSKLAWALLGIPYSTSTVESVFSEFKVFKTRYRNRMSFENLEESVLTEQHFKSENSRLLPDMIPRYFALWKNDQKSDDQDIEKQEIQDYPSKIEEIREQLVIAKVEDGPSKQFNDFLSNEGG